ncbi:MAG: NAD-dependent epimerase/dehydratase family protein [Candidatus Viridilinea halotolerans]|uniref:NAD-dependent epimerase/dehydratase family protein n=1 Tax=Candidatus Viridilinea halotolerans TaxID=2491704 RepID=A0A426U441_9CHLR|nr:MAG: NAD-dependent epimerase/dehydratase family protein [Candidatus Viridilinea halotolerans]
MPTSLVTGGAGFIGSHLVERLLQRGDHVRVLDNFSTGHAANLAPWRANIEVIEGDLRDAAALARATAGVDLVFHQAALPLVQQSVDDPATTNAVNVDGTLQLLLAARDAGVRRVVVASSAAVYGDDPQLPKHERMPIQPLSPYAVSKLATEQYALVFAQLYALEAVALRYFNVFGPRQDPRSPYSGVIARFCAAARAGAEVTIFGDGSQSRDFVAVADVVSANLLAALAPAANGQVINIARGEQTSLLELIRLLEELTGRSLPVRFAPARSGDILHSLAAIDRAQALLGFRPQVSLREGLHLTL